MKTNFKIIGCVIVTYFIITSCKKTEYDLMPNIDVPVAKNLEVVQSPIDTIIFGNGKLSPLTGTLTNIVSENFESGGQTYYCFQLKLEKLYGHSIVESKNGGGVTDCTGCLSYSINFKFFTGQKDGPIDETYTIEYLNDILSYYTAMNQYLAYEQKVIAFLYGDITFDPDLDFNEYKEYRDSQVRIKSGTLHIKKSDGMYLVSFKGQTETGEEVSCYFNDTISFVTDDQKENSSESFSTTEVPENYILKDGKYYKLDEGSIYLPYNQNVISVRVLLRSYHDYYWYENNDNENYEWYPGMIAQRWRQNAVILQFQLQNIDQFQSKTYQIVPSDVNTGYDYQFLPTEQVGKFPNDSMCIGFYHISADMNYIEWMSLGYSYGFTDYFVLQSGKLEVTKQYSYYELSGKFKDSQSKEVTIKFKTTGLPIQYNN